MAQQGSPPRRRQEKPGPEHRSRGDDARLGRRRRTVRTGVAGKLTSRLKLTPMPTSRRGRSRAAIWNGPAAPGHVRPGSAAEASRTDTPTPMPTSTPVRKPAHQATGVTRTAITRTVITRTVITRTLVTRTVVTKTVITGTLLTRALATRRPGTRTPGTRTLLTGTAATTILPTVTAATGRRRCGSPPRGHRRRGRALSGPPPRTRHATRDDEDVRGGSYEPAETDAEPDVPGPGRGISRRKGRAAATRLRKSRRRVYRWSGIAIVIVLLAAGGVWIFGRSTPAPTLWVTNLLAGEYKSVPNACTAVNTNVLDAYLPKSGRTQRVSVGTGTDSQCSYSFDKQPTFIVLQITAEALQPFAAAGNNGSATANAQVNYTTARQALARPPKRSPLPPATITPAAGLGQQALVAIQHEHVSGIGTDVVTILIRQRNDLITVSCPGRNLAMGSDRCQTPR